MKLQIKIDGKTYEAEVEILEEEISQPAFAPYTPAPAPAQTPVHSSYAAPPVVATNEKQILSPVNGLVIRVEVAAGQQVQPNEVLMVIEAMKMENNIVVHRPGKVKCVHVTPGNPVKLHQILLELE